MSLQALSTVWDCSHASGTTLLVLLKIADHADVEGFCYPSEKTLAEASRCDVRSVRRAVSSLQDLGEIEVWEWVDQSNARHNGFRLLVGDFSEWAGVRPGDRLPGRAKTAYDKKIPKSLRETVFARDGNACVYCSSVIDLGIDHIIPRKQDGSDEIENLCCACAKCNRSKGARTPEQWAIWKVERARKKEQTSEASPPDPQDNMSSALDEMSYPDRTPVSYPARAILSGVEPPVKDEPSKELGTPYIPLSSNQGNWKVDKQLVTEEEEAMARDVLAHWNEVAKSSLNSKPWLGKIVMRIREHPEATLADHQHIIDVNWANPWWKPDSGPTPSVIYGSEEQFDRSIARTHAKRTAGGKGAFEIAKEHLEKVRAR